MKKRLLSVVLVLVFTLTGCFATLTPSVSYTTKPAYVYYDNLYGTYVYLPYKMKVVSNRYIYRKHIRNYRGKYKTYNRSIRFYKPRVKVKKPHKKPNKKFPNKKGKKKRPSR
jgi:hypothetical protein